MRHGQSTVDFASRFRPRGPPLQLRMLPGPWLQTAPLQGTRRNGEPVGSCHIFHPLPASSSQTLAAMAPHPPAFALKTVFRQPMSARTCPSSASLEAICHLGLSGLVVLAIGVPQMQRGSLTRMAAVCEVVPLASPLSLSVSLLPLSGNFYFWKTSGFGILEEEKSAQLESQSQLP